jgi:hypothetical protein
VTVFQFIKHDRPIAIPACSIPVLVQHEKGVAARATYQGKLTVFDKEYALVDTFVLPKKKGGSKKFAKNMIVDPLHRFLSTQQSLRSR